MAKFIVVGVFQDVQMHLTLPAAKHFEVHTVNDGESELQVEHIINKAVCSERWDSTTHTRPFIFRDDQSCKPEELPKTLQHILCKHPYPLSQGPVFLPLDCATKEKRSVGELITAKTVFKHDVSQDCYEWVPVGEGGGGVSSWGCFEVKNLKLKIHGAASTMNMQLVYTCNNLKCVIFCPCKICTDETVNCKLQCRAEVCSECNIQCHHRS